MSPALLWLILAIIWSSSYAAIKLGIASISPLNLVAGRMLLGAVIMLLILRWRGQALSLSKQVWITYGVTGLLGNVIPFFLISYGEAHVESALAAIFMGLAPVVTVLLAHIILPDEPLNARSAVGVAIGFIGLIVLVRPSAFDSFGSHLGGQLAILGAALCYATTTLYSKRYAKRPPLEMAAGSMFVGAAAVTFVATLLFDPSSLQAMTGTSLAAMLYLGAFPTALATLIYFYLIPKLGAARLSQVNFAVPLGGALIGVLFLNETLVPSVGVAMIIIVAAVYLVTSSKPSARKFTQKGY